MGLLPNLFLTSLKMKCPVSVSQISMTILTSMKSNGKEEKFKKEKKTVDTSM